MQKNIIEKKVFWDFTWSHVWKFGAASLKKVFWDFMKKKKNTKQISKNIIESFNELYRR